MDRAGKTFAFQIEPRQHPRQSVGASDTLASREATIKLENQAPCNVTLFFRVPKEQLVALRKQGRADSSKETIKHLKELLLAQGSDPEKIEQSFKVIREYNRSSEKGAREIRTQRNSQSGLLQRPKSAVQIAAGNLQARLSKPADAYDIPFSLVNKTFTNAMQNGEVLRVDSALNVSHDQRPSTQPVMEKKSPNTARVTKPLPPTPSTAGKIRPASTQPKPLPPVPAKPAQAGGQSRLSAAEPASPTDKP